MNKTQYIILFFFISGTVCAQSFNNKDLRLGGGLYFATEYQSLGVALDGVYVLSDDLEASATYTHIIKREYRSVNILEFDAHYIFYTDIHAEMYIYGIGGLQVGAWFYNRPDQIEVHRNIIGDPTEIMVPGEKDNGYIIGINLGVGINFQIKENINLAPELRFTATNPSYLRFGACAQYMF